jgi:hypothetical protein
VNELVRTIVLHLIDEVLGDDEVLAENRI